VSKGNHKSNAVNLPELSNAFLSHLLDALPIAVFCKDYSDGRGTFVGWNAHAESLWGLKRDLIIGKTDADFFPKEQVERFREKDLETLRSGKTVYIKEEPVESPAGLRIVRTWKVPLGNDQSKNHFLLGISLDMTEQKRIEEELEKEHQRVVAASGLANMNEMVASIAHEINNPLAIISGFADVLGLSINNGKIEKPLVERSIKGIRGAIDRIAKLIINMRKVNRDISTDEIQLCSIASIINESVSMFEAAAKAQGIQLTVNVAEKLPNVRGTETQLMQILTSLIRNSFQAVVGEPTKSIDVVAYLAETGRVTIDIIDSGVGISANLKDKVFQPFFTTREVNQGAGLGLSVSRATVESLSGTVEIASLSKPTVMRVSLPAMAILRNAQKFG
jgi:PAS domain S-box-containing protein